MGSRPTSSTRAGTTFTALHLDSLATWKVIAKAGEDAWRAVIADGEDGAGTVRLFTTAQIQASVAHKKAVDAIFQNHDDFFAGLKPGQIVHYSNGGGEFVRCRVVTDGRKRALMPIALVGTWAALDLPRRLPNGSVHWPYQADKIRKGEAWTPNAGCVLEYHGARLTHEVARAGGDPRTLPALDLSVPPMSSEEEATAALWRAVEAAQAALQDHQAGPRARLEAAQTIVAGALQCNCHA